MYRDLKHSKGFTHKQSKNAFKSQTDRWFGKDKKQAQRKIRKEVLVASQQIELETNQNAVTVDFTDVNKKDTNKLKDFGDDKKVSLLVVVAVRPGGAGTEGCRRAGEEEGTHEWLNPSLETPSRRQDAHTSLSFSLQRRGTIPRHARGRGQRDEHTGHRGSTNERPSGPVPASSVLLFNISQPHTCHQSIFMYQCSIKSNLECVLSKVQYVSFHII